MGAGADASAGRGHVGARLLPAVQEREARLPERHLGRHQLARGGQAVRGGGIQVKGSKRWSCGGRWPSGMGRWHLSEGGEPQRRPSSLRRAPHVGPRLECLSQSARVR